MIIIAKANANGRINKKSVRAVTMRVFRNKLSFMSQANLWENIQARTLTDGEDRKRLFQAKDIMSKCCSGFQWFGLRTFQLPVQSP